MTLPQTHVYRRVDPELVIAVWQKMDALLGRKQQGNSLERFMTALTKSLKKSESSIRKLLEDMVSDGLLESVSVGSGAAENSTSCITLLAHSGQRVAYYMPDFSVPPPQHLPDDSPSYQHHDWYCFQCHKAGEVVDCTECWRVFHVDCIRDYLAKKSTEPNALLGSSNNEVVWLPTQQPRGSGNKSKKPGGSMNHQHNNSSSSLASTGSEFVCHVCQSRPKCEFSRKQIRKLLDFATFATRKNDAWKHKFSRYGFDGDICRCEYLTYRYVDTDLLQNKISDGRYTSLEEFLIDVQVLVHGVCLLHGPFSVLADDARFMARTIESEIMEANLCTDCYINSKARLNDWISKPCKPPHDLIWAQMPGDEDAYFPAKLLLEKDDGYEVRFFGGTHERKFVPRRATLPFSRPVLEVPVKRGPGGFDRAWNEVLKLQDNVNEGYYTHSSGESDLPPSDDDYTDDMYLQPRRAKQRQNRAILPPMGAPPSSVAAMAGMEVQQHFSGANDVANRGAKKRRRSSGAGSAGHGTSINSHRRSSNATNSGLPGGVGGGSIDTTASILNRLNSRAPHNVELQHQHTLHPPDDDQLSSPTSSPMHYSAHPPMKSTTGNSRPPAGSSRRGTVNGTSSRHQEESVLSSSSEVSSSIQHHEVAHRSGVKRPRKARRIQNRSSSSSSSSSFSDEREDSYRDLSTPLTVHVQGSKKKPVPKKALTKPGKGSSSCRPTVLPSSSSSVASSSSNPLSPPPTAARKKAPVRRPTSPTRTIDDDLSSLSDSENDSHTHTVATSRPRARPSPKKPSPKATSSNKTSLLKPSSSSTKPKVSLMSPGGASNLSNNKRASAASRSGNKVRNGKVPARRPSQKKSSFITSSSSADSSGDSDATERCSLGATNGYHPMLYSHSSTAPRNKFASTFSLVTSPPVSPTTRSTAASVWPLCRNCECQTEPMSPEPPAIEYRRLPCDCEERFVKALRAQEEQERATTERQLRERREELELRKTTYVDKLVAETRGQNQTTCENLQRELQSKMDEAVASAKKRQWCRNCLKEAIYHCCWNTAYCSIACQQEHWHKEHKRACRRKRA